MMEPTQGEMKRSGAKPLDDRWRSIVDSLTFAFQPIVHIHNGETYGFEALLRGWAAIGFDSIPAVFDAADKHGVLLSFNRALQVKAQTLFEKLNFTRRTKLFFNVDNRVFDDEFARSEEPLFPSVENGDGGSHWFCVELSERHELKTDERFFSRLHKFQERHIAVAVDDFGSGFAGLMLLYKSNPDIIKIDRFFIAVSFRMTVDVTGTPGSAFFDG